MTTFGAGRLDLRKGDCLKIMDSLPPNSVDSIVCDPPYHLTSIVKRFGDANAAAAKEGADGLCARASRGFMGKEWDGGDIAFRPETWAKAFRVLKPGGHLVAFSAPKCQHRMVCAIEDAGFEIRDGFRDYFSAQVRGTAFFESLSAAQRDAFLALIDAGGIPVELQWVFGTGFPKSLDVSKAIDKDAGFWRGRAGAVTIAEQPSKGTEYERTDKGEPVTADAKEWAGWGSALKPAYEPICLARKPIEGTIAANVLAHGVGAINVDGCRIGDFVNTTPPGTDRYNAANFEQGYRPSAYGRDGEASAESTLQEYRSNGFWPSPGPRGGSPAGRWPANVVTDGSDEVVAMFPTTGKSSGGGVKDLRKGKLFLGETTANVTDSCGFGDSGSAARFFYSAKASKHDRANSKHPTVKPVSLMRWLCKLVTPPNGLILDPFAGSGTTGAAAHLEGFRAILCEREAEYQVDIENRLRELCGEDPPWLSIETPPWLKTQEAAE